MAAKILSRASLDIPLQASLSIAMKTRPAPTKTSPNSENAGPRLVTKLPSNVPRSPSSASPRPTAKPGTFLAVSVTIPSSRPRSCWSNRSPTSVRSILAAITAFSRPGMVKPFSRVAMSSMPPITSRNTRLAGPSAFLPSVAQRLSHELPSVLIRPSQV